MLTCAHIGEAGTAVVPEDEALSGCHCVVLQGTEHILPSKE